MNIKFIAIGAAAFAAGVGVGVFGSMKYFEKKYMDMAGEEIDSMKEFYAKHFGTEDDVQRREGTSSLIRAIKDNLDEKEEAEENAKLKVAYEKIATNYQNNEALKASINLNDPLGRPFVPEDEEPATDEEESEFPEGYAQPGTTRYPGNFPEPFVISLEQFSEENTHYDKITLCYYEEDNTLADEDEEIVADVSSVVGDEAVFSFGEQSEDPDTVYIRNEALSIDYEVIRLAGKSYQETVLGIQKPVVKRRKAVRAGEEK